MEPETINDELNHHRLTKAYLRLAEEAKRIKESPGVIGIKGEVPKLKKKQGKKPKAQPAEQLRLF